MKFDKQTKQHRLRFTHSSKHNPKTRNTVKKKKKNCQAARLFCTCVQSKKIFSNRDPYALQSRSWDTATIGVPKSNQPFLPRWHSSCWSIHLASTFASTRTVCHLAVLMPLWHLFSKPPFQPCPTPHASSPKPPCPLHSLRTCRSHPLAPTHFIRALFQMS